eukprot:TRINITY_DN40005_c0_g1_i1.p1 TRINITY_DN40005_c0_g1~~TRINITY_DN40005_c0_g1_i1.p1  ORF type:complete len:399 (-),score=71.46 TRINITY_DN40005_c0_g1_i1:64-1260(-)
MGGGRMELASFLLLALFRRDGGGAVNGDLRVKREPQFNTGQGLSFPQLPSGPGSARSLFDQIVTKINNGHMQQKEATRPQEISSFQGPPQNIGSPFQGTPQNIGSPFRGTPQNMGVQQASFVPQVPQTKQAPQKPSFNLPPTGTHINPILQQRFPNPNKIPSIQQPHPFIQPSKPFSPKIKIPEFTPDLSRNVLNQSPVQNLGLALFNKNPETHRSVQQTTPKNIFHALEAQLEDENRQRPQEQKILEELANKQRLQEIEESRRNRIRQKEAIRIQKQKELEERGFNERTHEESFRIQQQRELEIRVNNERLRMIEEERMLEILEAKRQKKFFKLRDKQFGLQEHLDERNRFSAHKAIANSFRGINPIQPKASQKIVIGLAGQRPGRFQNRPEPVDVV